MCLLTRSRSDIVLTLGFSVFLISEPTTESISLGVKGDAWLRLSNDNRRSNLLLLQENEEESKQSMWLCLWKVSFTQHRAIAIVDSELLFWTRRLLCIQPADWDILWTKELQKRFYCNLYLECVSGCWAGDVEIREIVTLWLYHALGRKLKINLSREKDKVRLVWFTAHSAVDSGKWQRSTVIIVRLVVESVERHLSWHLVWFRGWQKLVVPIVEHFRFVVLAAVDFAAFRGGHDGTLCLGKAEFHLNIRR